MTQRLDPYATPCDLPLQLNDRLPCRSPYIASATKLPALSCRLRIAAACGALGVRSCIPNIPPRARPARARLPRANGNAKPTEVVTAAKRSDFRRRWAEPSITPTVTNLGLSKRHLWQFDVHFGRCDRAGVAPLSSVAPVGYLTLSRPVDLLAGNAPSLLWLASIDSARADLSEAKAHPGRSKLRHRLHQPPPLGETGLWPAQAQAIRNLAESLVMNRPRASSTRGCRDSRAAAQYVLHSPNRRGSSPSALKCACEAP